MSNYDSLKGLIEEIYRRDSLSEFYNKFFGLKLSDLQSWVLASELRSEPKVEGTFIRFVNGIFNLSDGAIRRKGLIEFVEREINYKEFKKKFYEFAKLPQGGGKGLIEFTKLGKSFCYRAFKMGEIVESLKNLQQRTEEELEKLVPAILDKAFKGEL